MSSAAPSTWVVYKFGGSSVANAECFDRVATIVESQSNRRIAVVLSACKGVTDGLLKLVTLAEGQDKREVAAADLRAPNRLPRRVARVVGEYWPNLITTAWTSKVLRTTQVMRTHGQHVRDKVSGTVNLVTVCSAATLSWPPAQSGWVGACLRTGRVGSARPYPMAASDDWPARCPPMPRRWSSPATLPRPSGIQITLGRNGGFPPDLWCPLSASEIRYGPTWTECCLPIRAASRTRR